MDADWDDIRTVLALVRAKTLAAAGQALGVSYTTVARRVQHIEETMGVQLFERLSDGYRPTGAARAMADHAQRMEAEQLALMRRLQGEDRRLTGPLVITAPQLLIGPFIAPVLQLFSEAQPEVELVLRATNDLLDLSRREADLALRISGSPGDSPRIKGRKVCAQQTASYASPAYAESLDPELPVDWIVYEGHPHVPRLALERAPASRVRYVLDDMVAMLGAAQAGLGVVRLPMFLGRSTHGLVQVPLLPPQAYADVWVMAHQDVWPSAKVKAFRDMLVPALRARRGEFVA